MGWESRGNGRYYYRKQRNGRRVVSKYVTGSLGSLIEILDTQERSERKRFLQGEKANRDRLQAAAQEVDKISKWVMLTKEQTLIDNGFHRHKGQWRRKRNG